MSRIARIALTTAALTVTGVGVAAPASAGTGTRCTAVINSISVQNVTPVTAYLTAQATVSCPGGVIGQMSESGATESSGSDACIGSASCNLKILATLTGSVGEEKCVTFYVTATSLNNSALPASTSKAGCVQF